MGFSGVFPLGSVSGRDRAAAGIADASRVTMVAASAAIRAVPAVKTAEFFGAGRKRERVLLGRRARKAACPSRRHRKECRCHSAQWPPLGPKPSSGVSLALPQTEQSKVKSCKARQSKAK